MGYGTGQRLYWQIKIKVNKTVDSSCLIANGMKWPRGGIKFAGLGMWVCG